MQMSNLVMNQWRHYSILWQETQLLGLCVAEHTHWGLDPLSGTRFLITPSDIGSKRYYQQVYRDVGTESTFNDRGVMWWGSYKENPGESCMLKCTETKFQPPPPLAKWHPLDRSHQNVKSIVHKDLVIIPNPEGGHLLASRGTLKANFQFRMSLHRRLPIASSAWVADVISSTLSLLPAILVASLARNALVDQI